MKKLKVLVACKVAENAPNIVAVTRCKDCKFYTDNEKDDTLRSGYCDRIKNSCFDERKPDDFCNYGIAVKSK